VDAAQPEEQGLSRTGRVAAIGAVIAAVVLFALVVFGGGGGGYTVTATFLNAGQIVRGNPVQSGGVPIGSVKSIQITGDGHAEIEMSIDQKGYSPLREGTHATIRQFSQSGIANRYVDLTMPGQSAGKISDGGQIRADNTTTAVDLDELFNTLDPEARVALQQFFRGSAKQFAGEGARAKQGFTYLNPALATTSRLFHEVDRDTPVLNRFLVDSSKLVTDVAERRDQLAALVGNLNSTTRAIGDQKLALAESIGRLPPFMRRANTTFVNLRAALNDVDPLVNASKPVAKKLGPFLSQARRFSHDALPTVRDLSVTVHKRGPNNDLIEFVKSVPPLARVALNPTRVRGKLHPGAFPESATAFQRSAPIIAFARPYTTDFLGWLDDFSTTGIGADALGGIARGTINLAENLPGNNGPPRQGQFKRCPGSAEAPASDGSNVLSPAQQQQLSCTESDRATGSVR
jgi:phospholipid/cholesterol/gamma-HCH transport system substrate-binding protein